MASADLPHARPVDPDAWSGEETTPFYRDRGWWVTTAAAVVLLAATWATPFGIATAGVLAGVGIALHPGKGRDDRIVRAVHAGGFVLLVGLMPLLSARAAELSLGQRVAQAVGGMVLGLVVGKVVQVRRDAARRARRSAV
ncbi:hypothetical protein [Cellulomonas iranensis]|uniref:hypothetical protein n=1 Tax=Cellulomonas iranensis TaxID=76862 RepID=UPI000B3C3B86|nr:hypothetical protein [Cellulomonas iranensis]UCN14695.1 hypothetical protein LFM56_17880 [Cellulomonas iranensis]